MLHCYYMLQLVMQLLLNLVYLEERQNSRERQEFFHFLPVVDHVAFD